MYRYLTFKQYKQALFGGKVIKSDFNLIRSTGHKLHSIKVEKISLSSFDDKVWLCNDRINSRPFGHYKIVRKQ